MTRRLSAGAYEPRTAGSRGRIRHFYGLRSSRSRPSGIGSRGGLGHAYRDNPAGWTARHRAWAAAHPAYRHREISRMRERRRIRALERDRREVDLLVGTTRLNSIAPIPLKGPAPFPWERP